MSGTIVSAPNHSQPSLNLLVAFMTEDLYVDCSGSKRVLKAGLLETEKGEETEGQGLLEISRIILQDSFCSMKTKES
uniref:Uncharacterized protein n=1 Tax=Magallana gigas TaxID=29159 RepID=K1QRQ7_MAGGI